jgi:uncharacterized protein YpbB
MEIYLSSVVLNCLQKINTERTPYSVYHLLKGKKSSQTIQDAHLYHLTELFNTFPQLTRTYFEEIIRFLVNKNYIEQLSEEKAMVTQAGHQHLEQFLKEMPIPGNLNGWKHHSLQDDFWKRLSILVQVISNLIHYETSYIPIQHDNKTSEWVKMTLRKLNTNRDDLASQLLMEIVKSLTNDRISPEALVFRLTGYQKIGLTAVQAAEKMKLEKSFYHLHFLNCLHSMIDQITINSSGYPILLHLLSEHPKRIQLTKSSLTTYRYLQMGRTIDEIAVIRDLRKSTIEDHVVEIALSDSNFSIDPYLPQAIQDEIYEVVRKLKSKQLKLIRQELGEDTTYFQIRLVLAKLGDQLWN